VEDPDETLEDSVEEEEAEPKSVRTHPHLSIYDVNSWYKFNDPKPYIIIVLDDADAFPENVVREVLLLLR